MMVISKFETVNLAVNAATFADLKRLVEIQSSWLDQALLTGDGGADEAYFKQALTDGHLPPNGKKENYRIYTVHSQLTNETCAILELYHGYPDESTMWIGQFVVDKNHRNRGIGKEIIAELCNQASKNGFTKIGIGVHLKNWTALRFWSANGFDKIRSILGDKEYGANHFSVISLECNLDQLSSISKYQKKS